MTERKTYRREALRGALAPESNFFVNRLEEIAKIEEDAPCYSPSSMDMNARIYFPRRISAVC